MSDPISGTGLAGGALTGASVYGLLTGTDYGVVFGAFAGAVFYIATAADLSASRRLAYFIVSYIAGILCSGLVGSKLANLTGYSDKPLDAIGAVIVSALAVKILTFLNNQDIGSLVALITRRGGSGGAMPADNFGVEPQYPVAFRAWAKVIQTSATTWQETAQTGDAITHYITIRYRRGITADYEVVCDDSVYRVKRQRDLNGARRFLLLECTELGEFTQSHGGSNGDSLFSR